MLYTIAVVLVILWLLGLVTSFTAGGLIHALLVIALVVVLLQVISGRRNPLWAVILADRTALPHEGGGLFFTHATGQEIDHASKNLGDIDDAGHVGRDRRLQHDAWPRAGHRAGRGKSSEKGALKE
jgi:hypothetical protein